MQHDNQFQLKSCLRIALNTLNSRKEYISLIALPYIIIQKCMTRKSFVPSEAYSL